MKRMFILAAIVTMAACAPVKEQKVMARAVPERADDFVFENDLVAGRFYGKALEGNPTSPGLDIWVKLPGKLVADEWYAGALQDPDFYHHDHGGKDCYKVAVSLGGGASVPLIGGKMCFPSTNYRSCEVLETTPDKVVFALHYPQWEAAEGITVALDKKITVTAGSYFTAAEDTYTFTGADELTVAAGIKLHGAQGTVEEARQTGCSYAIWEKASDQSVEPEDGMIGVALVLPGAESVCADSGLDHALLVKTVKSGESVSYCFGSCWSKGDIKTAEAWFNLVSKCSDLGNAD